VAAAPPTFDASIGWIAPHSARARRPALALLVCDVSALSGIAAVLDAAVLDVAARFGWRVATAPTTPAGCALRYPDSGRGIFRASPGGIDLLSSPNDLDGEQWAALQGAPSETLGEIAAPSGVLAIVPLNEDALDLATAPPPLASCPAPTRCPTVARSWTTGTRSRASSSTEYVR
jgi:hypothetical protein